MRPIQELREVGKVLDDNGVPRSSKMSTADRVFWILLRLREARTIIEELQTKQKRLKEFV